MADNGSSSPLTEGELEEMHPMREPSDFSFRDKAREVRQYCSALSHRDIRRTLSTWIPAVKWMPKYKRNYIFNDVVAGVTNGIMNLPQGMAYGMLAGLTPAQGLYTSFYLPLIYAFFGSSKHVALGTFAITSLMNGQAIDKIIESRGLHGDDHNLTLTSNYTVSPLYSWFCGSKQIPRELETATEISSAITVMMGFIMIIMSLLRMGFLAVLLSDELVQGLTSAAGLTVMTVQIKHLLGIEYLQRPAGLFGMVKFYVCCLINISDLNWATVLTSVIVITSLVIIKEVIDPRTRPKIKVPIPSELIVVIIATAVYSLTDIPDRYDVKVVGKIPTGLAAPRVPSLGKWWKDVLPASLTIAIVLYSVECSLAKLFAKKHDYEIYPNQEFFALGVCHTVGAFFGCHTGGSSLSRSMIQSNQGAMSQVPSLVSSLIILTVLYAAAPLFTDLPKCVLSSIIVVALKGMYKQIGNLPPLWKKSKVDFFIWLVTFLAVLLLGLTYGLVAGLLFSLGTIIFRSFWPESWRLERAYPRRLYREAGEFEGLRQPHGGLRFFRYDAPLYYANAEHFRDSLYLQCDVKPFAIRKLRRKAAKMLKKSATADSESLVVKTNEDPGLENGRPEMETRPSVKVIVVDCSSLAYIDLGGVAMLKRVRADLATVDVQLWLANVHSSHLKLFGRTNFFGDFPKEQLFLSLSAAATAFKNDHSEAQLPTASEKTRLL